MSASIKERKLVGEFIQQVVVDRRKHGDCAVDVRRLAEREG